VKVRKPLSTQSTRANPSHRRSHPRASLCSSLRALPVAMQAMSGRTKCWPSASPSLPNLWRTRSSQRSCTRYTPSYPHTTYTPRHDRSRAQHFYASWLSTVSRTLAQHCVCRRLTLPFCSLSMFSFLIGREEGAQSQGAVAGRQRGAQGTEEEKVGVSLSSSSLAIRAHHIISNHTVHAIQPTAPPQALHYCR
jgi:hypothetical protein